MLDVCTVCARERRCDGDGNKKDVKTQGRRVVFIPLQQAPSMLRLEDLTSLDSEPQDASAPR
jgi:hypothetical protein